MSLSSLAGKAGLLVVLGSLAACGGGSGSDTDTTLSEIIAEKGLTGDPAAGRDLPAPTDPVAVLGKKLFFAKSLGGDMDSACVTCHHPMLGGGDKLSLSVGVGAVEPDLLGPGREDVGGDPRVPRNAPTVFNMGLYDVSLFHDGRVQVLTLAPGANGEGVEIDTPDSDLVNPDPNAGDNLIAAQARFPITSNSEMRGVNFEPFGSNQQVRDHLAARLGDYGVGAGELARTEWLAEFQAAYASALGASELVTYDNIAFAMGEYQRSMVFASNAWKDYVAGDEAALSESQKRGAVLFFKDVADGGAGCASCHSGDFFTDEDFHVLAVPQIGHGKGHGISNDDFGRSPITRDPADRYRFRTPTLLNVEVTAPYGHTGAYATLEDMIRHHAQPEATLMDYVQNARWCELPQFSDIAGCTDLYPNIEYFATEAVEQLEANRALGVSKLEDLNLTDTEVSDLAAFLTALTDPCVKDRACMEPWLVEVTDPFPDDTAVRAVDANGDPL